MSKKTIVIVLLFLTNIALGDMWTIPHQPRHDVNIGNTELGLNSPDGLYKDLRLSNSYEVVDKIYILPCDFQGESELYTLGFYVDWKYDIKNDYEANLWRVLYKYEYSIEDFSENNTISVPEPNNLFLMIVIILLLRMNKRGRSVTGIALPLGV